MEIKNISDLHQILTQLVQDGKGKWPVYFDTEARTFHYHMAEVGVAYFELEPHPHLGLHEKTDAK